MRDTPLPQRHPLLARLGMAHPILQAPMAGIATPALAAAVSDAGGLGALGFGPSSADAARPLLAELAARTSRPFGVNLFCAPPPPRDAAKEAAWLERLRPGFEALGAAPPERLESPFGPSLADPAMLPLLLEARPALVSFHLGLPEPAAVAALRHAGIAVIATATNLVEARQIEAAGFDAIVAQGIEAGGHRGMFEPDAVDPQLGTQELVRTLARHLSIPIVAAGGIMDGAQIADLLAAGAAAAQLGTAFLCCSETTGHLNYRAAMLRQSNGTVLTRAITGRPARAIANGLSALGDNICDKDIPAFPLPFTTSKALVSAAAAAHRPGFAILWAGTGMGRARALPAAALMRTLVTELERTEQLRTIGQ
jgi:nitronate monooxygenase